MIETFEIDEITETPLEDNEEQRKLIAQLGLEGQTSLISPEKKSILPYAECTKEQRIIIATLCSRRYKIEEYKRMQIPLRVLQVIAHVKEACYFDSLYIFDKSSEAIKDPFLIGIKGNYYNGVPYLLARWGDELESWSQLKEKSKEIIIAAKKSYKKKINKMVEYCEDIDGGIILPSFNMPDIMSYSDNVFNSEIQF